MRLTLTFREQYIEGKGSDRVGPFHIRGLYTAETESVSFVKSYPTHAIDYAGTWDGSMIFGHWELRRRLRFTADRGEFEIWPEREEETVERATEQMEAVA